MVKKILVIIPRFQIGGTNTSLRNLCAKIDRSKYEISVFAMSHSGPMKDSFEGAVILNENILLSSWITNFTSSMNLSKKILSFLIKSFSKLTLLLKIDLSDIIYKTASKSLSEKNFDAVIAFQEGAATKFASFIQNNNKIAWIRCNYQNYLDISHIKPESELYKNFNHIITVSEYTGEVFCNLLPQFAHKTKAIHNVIDDDKIIKMGNIDLPDEDRCIEKKFSIVSIGRLDPVKRFEAIPEIVQKIKKEVKKDFIWYIIGGGTKEAVDKIQNSITDFGVQDNLCYLGAKLNPYSYIRNSDLVVLTSLSEACPNVLNEAKILKVPVLSTNFGSVYEFIDNGENGFISSLEEIPAKLINIINGDSDYELIKSNLRTFRYDNTGILEKIYNII